MKRKPNLAPRRPDRCSAASSSKSNGCQLFRQIRTLCLVQLLPKRQQMRLPVFRQLLVQSPSLNHHEHSQRTAVCSLHSRSTLRQLHCSVALPAPCSSSLPPPHPRIRQQAQQRKQHEHRRIGENRSPNMSRPTCHGHIVVGILTVGQTFPSAREKVGQTFFSARHKQRT